MARYHSSTAADWPTPERPPLELGPFNHIPPAAAEHMREQHADQALHIGTYEAAVESMFRRMRNQDDAANITRSQIVAQGSWPSDT